ncbi:MAG: PEP-CTERM sorting domain-containing protein [Verrucomicrobia bacterium]|nr:PEP-CTERM sorting domain-containing protein [Verrucomicrobiota bacterium]
MAGDMFGEYRSNVAEYAGATAWVLPTDPTNKVVFAFNTSDIGGPNAVNIGYTSSTVVPEPSTYVFFGLGLGALSLGVLRRKLRAVFGA